MSRSVDSGRVPSGAVVITGTSTGIGRACALHLDAAGFEVFATVRREEDADRLRAERPRIHTLVVDVTDEDGVRAAAREVDGVVGDRGLAGLVNNAGTSVAGPLEFLPLDELRRQLEVNLVAHVGVTQAFLPAIRRARGRILNITSVGGRIVNPFMGPYHASKWGLEAVTDAQRKELRPWGIRVIAIEPGSIDTEIWKKGIAQGEELAAALPEEGKRLYGDKIPKAMQFGQRVADHGQPAESVAKAVERALTAKRPRSRYVVGADARALIALNQVLPDRAVDALESRMMGI
jgi:NAD(P)-dependent dehydrogenase (short-subunit alcohol dehydrogenase family)